MPHRRTTHRGAELADASSADDAALDRMLRRETTIRHAGC
jgi:hypothetical protein